jgi:hypothetical protein
LLLIRAKKVIAKKELEAELAMRLDIENNVAALVQQTGHTLENLMASIATPVTEDWECFKSSIEHFNQQCVHLGEYVPPPFCCAQPMHSFGIRYGMKFARVFANLCNAGVNIAAENLQC